MIGQLVRHLQRHLGRQSHLGRIIVIDLVAGLLQGAAMGLLVPFLQALLSDGQTRPGGHGASYWLAWVVTVALASVALACAASVQAYRIGSYDVCGRLIRLIGERVQRLPLGWFDASTTGRVSTAVSTDLDTVSHLPSIVLPQLAVQTGSAVGIAAASLWFEWRMAVAMVVVVPPALWCLRWLQRTVVEAHVAEERAARVLSSRVIELAQLQAVLRAAGTCREGWQPLEEALSHEHTTLVRANGAKAPAATTFDGLVRAGMVGALAVGVVLMLGGQADPAVLIAVAVMAVRFSEPIGMLAYYVDPLHESGVALDAVASILEAPLLPEPAPGHASTPRAPVDVRLREVSFGYTPGRKVIDGVDLELPAGSVTAVVGPSGSGKSTLTRLVARFWDVDSGCVGVGGVDVRKVASADLMAHISMVFQDVYLFDTTIEENVRVGRPGATGAEVREAARRAGLDVVVDSLAHGWDTRVGEGGRSLSGGERQRVAIARAFLKDAPVLLMDEVTSALDGVSEAGVSRALAELSQGRTVLVIAHRLSTIRRADRIVVLTEGRVEAVGTHEELYAVGGTYRQLWDDQEAVDRWRLVRQAWCPRTSGAGGVARLAASPPAARPDDRTECS